jgi:hypothetical protein
MRKRFTPGNVRAVNDIKHVAVYAVDLKDRRLLLQVKRIEITKQ